MSAFPAVPLSETPDQQTTAETIGRLRDAGVLGDCYADFGAVLSLHDLDADYDRYESIGRFLAASHDAARADELARWWCDRTRVEEGCWIWTRAVGGDGYGRVKRDGRYWRPHRLAFADFGGTLDSKLVIHHECRRILCVWPDHLRQISNRENVLLGDGPSAVAARRDSCSSGHALTPDNVYLWRGSRYCRACRREAWRRWAKHSR